MGDNGRSDSETALTTTIKATTMTIVTRETTMIRIREVIATIFK